MQLSIKEHTHTHLLSSSVLLFLTVAVRKPQRKTVPLGYNRKRITGWVEQLVCDCGLEVSDASLPVSLVTGFHILVLRSCLEIQRIHSSNVSNVTDTHAHVEVDPSTVCTLHWPDMCKYRRVAWHHTHVSIENTSSCGKGSVKYVKLFNLHSCFSSAHVCEFLI